MSSFTEYEQYDALGLAELVRRKEMHPTELVEAAIERITERNPPLNAVVHTLYDEARAAAAAPLPDGPLAGVPFLLKDLLAAYAGTPTTSSCAFERNYVPDHDTELVARYKRAGLIVVGRTNTPEYGLKAVTESEVRGPARNPWNPEYTPGGSSGGSGAAIAAGMVPVAHGGDGGGSIRVPASCCGLFGLKPTRGRNPMGPDMAESWNGFVLEHVLTRSVRDSAAVLDATHGPDLGAPYCAPPPARPFLQEVGQDPGRLRIGVTAQNLFGKTTHPDCRAALDDAAALLQSLGHEVEEVTLPIERETWVPAFLKVLAASTAADIAAAGRKLGREPTVSEFEITTWLFNVIGRKMSGRDLEESIAFAHAGGRAMARFMERYDVVVTLTQAHPPTRIGEQNPKPIETFMMKLVCTVPVRAALDGLVSLMAEQVFEATGNTMPFNMTGQPAMSVPLYWNEAGLPIGLQFVGRFGDEATLFRLAGQLEQARPWRDRRPRPLT